MPNVVRFALSTARDLYVPGLGKFTAGVLDVDADDLDLVARARYLTAPFKAVEVGIVDSTTPLPSLPAVPEAPAADPYPQYVTDAYLLATSVLVVGTAALPITNAATARPAGAVVVYWICAAGVTPTNAAAHDLVWNA